MSERRLLDERVPSLTSSRYLGPAVKQLTPSSLQSPLPEANIKEKNSGSSTQLKRDLGAYHDKTVVSWLIPRHLVGSLTFAAVLGCFLWASCKLFGLSLGRLTQRRYDNNTTKWTVDSLPSGYSGRMRVKRNVADRLEELLSMFTMRMGSRSASVVPQKSFVAASLSSPPLHSVIRSSMPIEEAESLVRQWQVIKAEVLGPDYRTELLYDVLEEPMLLQVNLVVSS